MGLIARDQKPVMWRGPMVSGAVMQLMAQTDWQELDYLIIDTPPGTGDAQLTLLQRLPLNAAIIVTTPQDVSISDTKKGIEMIKRFELPILGLIENMSFFKPEKSKKKYYIFGKGGGKKLSKGSFSAKRKELNKRGNNKIRSLLILFLRNYLSYSFLYCFHVFNHFLCYRIKDFFISFLYSYAWIPHNASINYSTYTI